MSSFVHLHVHSEYSLLDGACRLDELVQAAILTGMPALGLTDHNALYGSVAFHDKCVSAGIKPIIGMELNLTGGTTLVLLAREKEGYRNLCRLSSLLQGAADREEALRRGLGVDEVDRHRAGMIALSAGRRGDVEQHLRAGRTREAERAARHWCELFGPENYFLELQIPIPGEFEAPIGLAMLANRVGVRCVATNNVHYLESADKERQRVLAAIRTLTRVDESGPDKPLDQDASFLPPAEMARRFEHFPAALEQTLAIAERCHLEFPRGEHHFPLMESAAGDSQIELLRQAAWDGLENRGLRGSPEAVSRMEMELEVIADTGYAGYFLAVAEIIRFARHAGVPFSARGSSSSSLVVHALGISDVNPLEHDLYFERFLNRARREPPDIDVDLCSHRRDEVLAYVYRRFGEERVAMVCTFSTLRARSALREVAKAYGIPEERIRVLAGALPRFWMGGKKEQEKAWQELSNSLGDQRERKALTLSREIEGYVRHISIHAGGIVIAPGPLTDWVAVQRAPKGLLVTQADGPGVERLGLIKIDLLGVRGLSVMQSTVEKIRRFHDPVFSASAIADGEEKTGGLLATGRTIGCFQIESIGMQSTLRQLKIHDIDGIIIGISLFRPGPIQGGLRDAFVRRYLGQEEVSYLHPALEPILGETLGVILYQEQVLRVAHEVAGLSLEQADTLRRAMSKFRSAHEMATMKEAFVQGAGEKSAIPKDVAEEIWSLMKGFAGYGFPKAHAAGYATVAYRSAYLKACYPAEFMSSRLADWGGYYPQRVYLNEARRLGLELRPPHVNHSDTEFSLEYWPDGKPLLWMGLDQVRGLTRRTIIRTLQERTQKPFSSLNDWLMRVNPRRLEAENLARVGALDGLGESRRAMLSQVKASLGIRGQLPLPFFGDDAAGAVADGPDMGEILETELELLGVTVSAHPLELYRESLSSAGTIPSTGLERKAGQEVAVAGMRVAGGRTRTRGGDIMLFLTLEDFDGLIEVVIFPKVYERYRRALSGSGPFLVRGYVQPAHETRGGNPVIVASALQRVPGASCFGGAGRW